MSLSILSGKHSRGHTPVNELGAAPVTVLGIVGSGDPNNLTVADAGSSGEGEEGHRFGW